MDSILLLNSLFAGYAAEGFSVLSELKMGFSGAKVQEIAISKWMKVGDEADTTSPPPLRLFVKHVVFVGLPASTPEAAVLKDVRNRQSYLNEIAVLDNYLPTLRKVTGLTFPATYKVVHSAPDLGDPNSVESFTFISESLSPVAQQFAEFSLPRMRAVLNGLAEFHATYHGKIDQETETVLVMPGDVHARHDSGVWHQGTHLALAKRPPLELVALPDIWRDLCGTFSWPELVDSGIRLAAIAPYVAERLSSFAGHNSRKTTLVHGDVKPGNIFFGSDPACDSVHLIDFQWTGIALAATDLIYVIATSSSDSVIQHLEIDRDILRPYYEAFVAAYKTQHSVGGIDCASFSGYSFEELQYDFQLSTLDYVRWIVSSRLKGETPAKYATRREVMDPNLGSYRRSEVALRFLFNLVHEYLPIVESEMALRTSNL
jgi:hypothetical protein